MATILVEILGNAKQFKAELDKAVLATEKANGGLSKMSKAAGVAGLALAGGLAYGLVKSVDAATKFQGSMELIQTQAGASTKEVHNMSKALLNMAGNVGSTPETLSKGLYHVESAGFRGAKALSILRLAAEGAAVGHSDLEATTTALVAAQRSGIKGLGDMSHAMGTLNAIVGAGNMRMDDLTSALGTGILPVAKVFGLTISDVGGALATMTSNGIPAVNAASALKMMFASLAAPTHAAKKALDSIGLSSTDLADTMRHKGLGAALAELQMHMKDTGLNATQSAALLTTAFGKKSSTGLLTLLGNLKDVKSATEQVTAGASSFGKNWDETTQSNEFKTKKLQAALSALGIELGTVLLPAVTSATQELAHMANFLEQHKTVAKALMITLGALAGVLITVGLATKIYAAGQVIVTAATKVWAAGQWLLNAALSANPIGVVIIAVAALAAGIVIAYEHSATFRRIVTEALNAVSTAANTVLGFFKSNWPIIGALIFAPFAPLILIAGNAFGIRSALVGAFNDIKTAVSRVMSTIVSWVSNLPGRISSALGDLSKTLYNAGVSVIQGLYDGMTSKVKDVYNLASGIAGKIASLKGPIEVDRVLLTPHGHAIIEGLLLGLSNGLTKLPGTLSAGVQKALDAGRNTIQAAQSSFAAAWSSLTSSADSALSKLQATVKTKTEKIIASMQSVAAAGQLSKNLSDARAQLGAAQAGPQSTDAEKALAALQQAHSDAGLNDALANAQSGLATAQAGGDPAAILAAQQALSDAQYNLQVDALNKRIAAESATTDHINAIKQGQQAVEDALQAQSDANYQATLDKRAAAERVQLDARNALQQTHFDAALTNLGEHLAKGHESYKEAHKAILKLFKTFGVNYSDAGAELGTAFITGLKETIQGAAKGSGSLSGKLSDVADSIHIPHAATGGFVAQTGLAVIHQGETITPAGKGGGVTVVVNGWVGNDQDIAEKIRNVLIRTGRNTTHGALGGFA